MKLSIGFGYLLLALSGFGVAAQAIEPVQLQSRVFALSPAALAETKARLRANDPALQSALGRLRRQAAEAVQVAPLSVMDKSRTPPSGDKHDYLSLAPYFWPDPNKKDGIPYINRDGEVNPESRTGTDYTTMIRMGSSVETLALAYYLMDDDAYAQHAVKLLRVWFLDAGTRMNPRLEYGQGVVGKTAGNPWGIIETTRLIGILDAVSLLECSPAWTPQDRRGMSVWCQEYLNWLRTSELGQREARSPNNHGPWYDAQIVRLALYLGQKDLARETLEAAKHRRIDAQIEPDGSQPRELARTKSFHYSLFNLRAMFTLASLGERVGVDLWHYRSQDGRSIRAVLDAVAQYANPEKQWPHKELRFRRAELVPILHQAAGVYHEPRYQRLLQLLPAEEVASNRVQLLCPRKGPGEN